MSDVGKPIRGRLVGRRIAAPGIAAAGAVPGATAGVIAPASSLTGLVQKQLAGKFGADPGIRFGDGSF